MTPEERERENEKARQYYREHVAKSRVPRVCVECGKPIPEGSKRYLVCSEKCRNKRRIRQTMEREAIRHGRVHKAEKDYLNDDIEAAMKILEIGSRARQ